MLDISHNEEFQEINMNNIYKVIYYLLENNQPFNIVCEYKNIEFKPELPSDITDMFGEHILFSIVGYSFESSVLNSDIFLFEAGFGSENIGTVVNVPLLNIKQILVNEIPILINMASSSVKKKVIKKNKDDSQIKNSMEALLNNPKNKKFIKKS